MSSKKPSLGMNVANLGLKALLSDMNATAPITNDTNSTPALATMSATNSALHKLPLDALQPGKYQPRRDIDPATLEELANSIRAQGVIQPILVRQIDNMRYEIVAGERRWRASQLAALTEIPAIVREISDEQAAAVALIENLQRENLNAIDTALGLQRLLNDFSMTHHEIAETVGKSRTTVTNLLRLLDLQEDVKVMLQRGELEMGHARAMLPLDPIQQLRVARTVVDKELSVRATETLIRDMLSGKTVVIPKKQDPDIFMLQNQLQERLGSKITIHHSDKGKGKIVINYNSLDEFEGILDHFQ